MASAKATMNMKREVQVCLVWLTKARFGNRKHKWKEIGVDSWQGTWSSQKRGGSCGRTLILEKVRDESLDWSGY